MNFKTIGFNAAVAATVVVGAVIATSSAQALVVGGTPNYNPLTQLPTTLSVSGVFNDGDLSGGFTDVTGLIVNPITFSSGSSISGFNANHNAISNFITGFDYLGVNAVIDLDAGEQVLHTIMTMGSNTFVSTLEFDFTGIIRAASNPSQILGSVVGGLSANQSVVNGVVSNTSNFSLNLTATPVPTPALLPGLLGMSVAAVRKKRKGEDTETAEKATANA